MKRKSDTPSSPGEAKGKPDTSRERTEDEMEKGLPAHQRRGPQDKSDPRPAPDKSTHDQ
nr:hypothetical protein [uncultured Roseococcus sp.]